MLTLGNSSTNVAKDLLKPHEARHSRSDVQWLAVAASDSRQTRSSKSPSTLPTTHAVGHELRPRAATEYQKARAVLLSPWACRISRRPYSAALLALVSVFGVLLVDDDDELLEEEDEDESLELEDDDEPLLLLLLP